MSRRRDPLRLSAHWHLDYSLETDLPEDSIIGAHFVVNVLFGLVTFGMVLLFSWATYQTVTVRNQVHHWETQISANQLKVREIQRMQREYVAEAAKIDRAYAAARPTLNISQFLAVLAGTLPPQVTVDMIDWNDSGIVLRGYTRESTTAALSTLGAYVESLRTDTKFSQRFSLIRMSGFERRGTAEIQNFELTFSLQPLPPL